MKKTKLTRSLLAAFSIVALSVVLSGCLHSGGDGGPTVSELDLTADGGTVEAGTYSVDSAPAALVSALTDYTGPTSAAAGESLTIGGYTFTCGNSPCSVTVSEDGETVTTTGTITVAMAATEPVEPEPMPTPQEQIAALQEQINALRAELGLPAIDIDDLTGSVATLTQERDDLQKQVDDAADEAAKMAAAAATKLGKDLYAALGPNQGGTTALTNIGAPTLDADGLDIDAAAGAGALPDATDPAELTLEATDMMVAALGSWNGTMYSHSAGMGDTLVTNEAVVYTNQGPARSLPFSDTETGGRYTLITTAGATQGYVLLGETATPVTRANAAAFTHQGTQTHQVPSESDAFYVSGTYDGAPGRFRCTGTCSSTNDGSGSPSALGGEWHFKPDAGAMVSQPDDEYLYYGWWVSKDNDGMPTAASAFVGVVEPNAGDLDNGGDLTALTGSATYVGNAAGKYAINNVLTGTAHGGHFTADAMLMATFGTGDTAGVTGTIDNFRLNDGDEDPGWSVALARGGVGAAGAISAPASDATVWSINGNAAPAGGTWSGTMYDEMPGDPPNGDGSNIPTTVIGTFYSEFSTMGRMAGAFGADRQ